MRTRTGPSEPKPFFFVPIDSKRPPRRERAIEHDRFQGLTGALQLYIRVEPGYLYVGSGRIELDEHNRAYYAFARCNGKLVIPGTSIKGAVRSIVEAISNSCVVQGERDQRSGSHSACQDLHSLCPACRLFGTTGYAGRACFSDAYPVGKVETKIVKIADLWPPRRTDGRKFYQFKRFVPPEDDKPEKNHRFLESVPKGTTFATSLSFANLLPAEMGLILRALGLGESRKQPGTVAPMRYTKLGGGKPRCLGSVYFAPAGLRLVSLGGDNLFQGLSMAMPGEQWQPQLLAWLKNNSLLDKEAYDRFIAGCSNREVCQAPCPTGVY